MNPLVTIGALLLAALAPQPGPRSRPYPAGELLQYKVKLRYGILAMTAGTATMTVHDPEEVEGKKAARIELRVRSSGFVSRFFSVDDHTTSLVDVETGGTLRFRYEKKERDATELQEFTCDPATHAASSFRRDRSGKEERARVDLDGPVQDVLSLFYQFRRLPLKLGKFEEMTVFQGRKPYPLRFGADGLEQVKVKGVGVFWAIVVHPTAAMPGLFSAKGEATIWLEETTHVMLKMVIRMPKGSASMYLIRVDNSPLLEAPGATRGRK